MKTPEQRATRLMELVENASLPESEFNGVEFLKYANAFWATRTTWTEEYKEQCLQALCDILRDKGYIN